MKIGQIVVKLNGRFAGYYGFVKEILDKEGRVIIGIPLNDKIIKEKKSNIKHILPIPGKIIDEEDLKETSKAISSFRSLGFNPGERIKI